MLTHEAFYHEGVDTSVQCLFLPKTSSYVKNENQKKSARNLTVCASIYIYITRTLVLMRMITYSCTLQKLNGCFDLAEVILVAVLRMLISSE